MCGFQDVSRVIDAPFASAELSRALVPRSVTVALALPIAAQLDAPLSITAAAVVLTGKQC